MIAFVLGTRPEIIKLAPVMWSLPKDSFKVVFTGQHWSPELTAGIREPLGLGEPEYAIPPLVEEETWKVGRLMASLEGILREIQPRAVLVQGDTDSVLAGTLAATHAGFPVVHVEAGMRSFEPRLPEERIRRLVGVLADLHCCPTAVQRENLRHEGVPVDRLFVTGNPVVDALERMGPFPVQRGPYIVATLHREDSLRRLPHLMGLLAALAQDRQVLLFAHPRTRLALDGATTRVEVRPAVGYSEFLAAVAGAWAVVTDSGGVQEEAITLGVPCVTLRESTERPETTYWLGNLVLDPMRVTGRFLCELVDHLPTPAPMKILGDGKAGLRIATIVQARFA